MGKGDDGGVVGSRRLVVDGALNWWSDGIDDDSPGGFFEIRVGLTGPYSGWGAEQFFRTVTANGKRVRLVIESEEEVVKVLFLDVDGVLNSNERRAYDYEGVRGMDRELTANLRRIIEETGCKVVVSSNWRLGGIGPGSDFAKALADADPSGTCLGSVIGATPCRMPDCRRRNEILEWMNQNPSLLVTRYAIVDDKPSSIVGGQDDWLHEHMFATDDDLGLTAEVADRVIAHLNGGGE